MHRHTLFNCHAKCLFSQSFQEPSHNHGLKALESYKPVKQKTGYRKNFKILKNKGSTE